MDQASTHQRTPLPAEEHPGGGSISMLRDLIIGVADGLTVPFALAAGITGAIAASGVVVTAGLAELAGGAVSMGLGGYLAARTEAQHYAKERAREFRETREIPNVEKAEVASILAQYGLKEPVLTQAVEQIARDRERWVNFMMRNELGLEEPQKGAETRSALLVGGGYVLGGVFPLGPYLFVPEAHQALLWSIAVTSFALLGFGAVRARVLQMPLVQGAIQSWFTGAVAAAIAYGLARLAGHA